MRSIGCRDGFREYVSGREDHHQHQPRRTSETLRVHIAPIVPRYGNVLVWGRRGMTVAGHEDHAPSFLLVASRSRTYAPADAQPIGNRSDVQGFTLETVVAERRVEYHEIRRLLGRQD
jgi:hypothetical protein